MTVLILAPEWDLTVDGMVAALERRGVPVVRMDTALFPQHAQLDARLTRDGRWVGELSTATRCVNLEGLRSIWYRSPSAFAFPEGMSATERHWANSEAKLGLGGVLVSLPVLWVNHPARLADAAYKPAQLATAARCGLRVPDTVVTNEPDAVRRFAIEGSTVAKALGAPSIQEAGGRQVAFTHLLDGPDLADLRGVELTAHQFQRWVPKAYEVRVIAVGEHLFSAGIFAGSDEGHIDWRTDYDALTYTAECTPPPIRAGIRAYLDAMKLTYGAFDFVVQPNGAWIFLECNAGGQFGWIEDALGAPITDTLADLLARGLPA